MTMKPFRATFEIAEKLSCPLYEQGERMELTDRTFSCPEGKEVCLILVRDMTQLLFDLMKQQANDHDEIASKLYSCSGCTGLIKFRRTRAGRDNGSSSDDPGKMTARINAVLKDVHGMSVESRFLQAVPPDKVEPVIRSFQQVEVPRGKVLVHQGEPNPNIYLIASGMFAVENNRQRISLLNGGELFGEMSYLGAGPAVASVRALENAVVLAMRADAFSKLLSGSTSVQAFMAKLLAERLQQINQMRVRDFEYVMSGRFTEVSPAEIFQVFHMHQKSGALLMDLPKGKARVAFREGAIVVALYGSWQGEDAVYGILAEKKGYYRFNPAGLTPQESATPALGDFMAMLMEGIRRVDEANPEYLDDYTEE